VIFQQISHNARAHDARGGLEVCIHVAMHTPAEKFSKVALNCRWQGYLLTALAEVEGVVATGCEVLEGIVEYDTKLLRVKTSPAFRTFNLDSRRICFDSAP
jgi:hypothetical protein